VYVLGTDMTAVNSALGAWCSAEMSGHGLSRIYFGLQITQGLYSMNFKAAERKPPSIVYGATLGRVGICLGQVN
jgi:hypothetical protein